MRTKIRSIVTASFLIIAAALAARCDTGGAASPDAGLDAGQGADACTDCAGNDGGGSTDSGAATDSGGIPDGGGTTDGGGVTDGGCATIDDCGDGMFCRKADGDCTGTGTCDPKPAEDCGGLDEVVCGCDGESYGSPCWANSYGVNVRSAGQCAASTACSGDGVNGGCPEGSFCRSINDTCGGGGHCTLVPLECPAVDYTVCACDDKTYQSRCHAEMASQSIQHQKECGSMLACTRNDQCAADELCAKPVGACEASAPGKCDRRPGDCFMTRAIAPRCGCDGYSYSNDCWAGAAGAVVAHAGECDGDVICRDASVCKAGELCQKRAGVCDMGFGVCRAKPADCPQPRNPAPVCGCDLATYGDECTAWMGDASVKHEGECTGPDDSFVRYFYADDAFTPDGLLRIVVAPDDVREFTTTEAFTEALHDQNQMTLTIRFYESALPESDYAELQYTLALPPLTPYGIFLGYDGSYLRWHDHTGAVRGEMEGTILTWEYVPLDSGAQVSTLKVEGLNLSVK